MFIVDLQCKEGHNFEGWYDSTEDYYDRLSSCEITCPLCNCAEINRRPSIIGITKQTKSRENKFNQLQQFAHSKNTNHVKVLSEPPISIETQKAIARILQKVRQSHIDVGNQFAKRAIAMARDEEPFEQIIGQSTPEEEKRLDEEGIPYFKIPVPDIEKN